MRVHVGFLLFICLICLGGCATTGYYPGEFERVSTAGIYHEVRTGESLWKISKLYDINLKKIINANRLPDASKIEVGQLIFIPEAEKVSKRKGVYAKSIKVESFAWPARGSVVSYFGSVKDMVKNKGIDIQVPEDADISASRSGKATFVSDHLEGYGKTIIIDHLDGFQTVYAHNAKNLVGKEQSIKQGELIAKAGKTGRANKPTLHFEIRKNHKPQNPFYYLP